MKLTKGMKKALSLVLTSAMEVTGVNISSESASARLTVAADGDATPVLVAQWTGSVHIESSWGASGHPEDGATVTTDEGSTLELTPLAWNDQGVGLTVDLSEYSNPVIEVVATAGEADKAFAVTDAGWFSAYVGVNSTNNEWAKTDEYGDEKTTNDESEVDDTWTQTKKKDADEFLPADTLSIKGALDKTVSEYAITAQGRDITAVYLYDSAVKSEMDDFYACLLTNGGTDQTVSDKGVLKVSEDTEENLVKVTGDATYAISATILQDLYDVDWFGINTTLKDTDLVPGFDIAFKALSIETDTEITTIYGDEGKDDLLFRDGKKTGEEPVVVNIINKYNKYTDDTGIDEDPSEDAPSSVNALASYYEKLESEGADQTELYIPEESRLTVYFTVTGMGKTASDSVAIPEEGVVTKEPTNTPTAAPAATPTGSAITSGAGVSTAVSPGTVSITVKKAKRTVLVAAGKSKTVPFTAAVDTERNATETATISAVVSGNTKVKAAVSGSNVTIKATKKAVKGSTATVVLTSENASGAAVKSAKIKVTVQNKVKKIAAKKKTVTLKKGKTAKVVITIKKAENIKKLTTDTVKVTSKLVKLKTAKIAKKKVTVTLKAKKKTGSKATTIKVGTQKVKITTQVK